jgi:hypothetical protein
MKSPLQVFRGLRKPKSERQEERRRRSAEKHANTAERMAARTAAEARRYSNQGNG